MRIYGVARTRAFRALWVAEELGIPYEHLPVEIGDAGARTPEFLALNPNGRLPVIVDGDFVLPESLAITLYLAKKHAPGKLYPAKLEDEARVWQWSFWAIAEVDRGVNIWSLHAVRLPPAERNAALRDEALNVIAAPFRGARRGGGAAALFARALISPLPISMSLPSSAAPPIWILRHGRICRPG